MALEWAQERGDEYVERNERCFMERQGSGRGVVANLDDGRMHVGGGRRGSAAKSRGAIERPLG